MTKKTYRGSCRCGAIRFDAEVDLEKGTTKCNCTQCWKSRWWGVSIKPDAFRLLQAPADLGYGFPTDKYGTRALCKTCGIIPFCWGNLPMVDGDYVALNVACLDDLDPAELIAAPIQYLDGRNDSWWNAPAETRHL